MTALSKQFTHDRLSVWGVVAITLVALVVGWSVKSSLDNQVRVVEQDGVTASIPQGWLVQDGTGDLILTTRDPLASDLRYSISLIAADEATLADVAATRNLAREQLLDGYTVIDETPIVRGGQEGYKVTFAYVSSGAGEPAIVKGVEYSFVRQQYVLVVTMETDSVGFENALYQFGRFLDSVSVTE